MGYFEWKNSWKCGLNDRNGLHSDEYFTHVEEEMRDDENVFSWPFSVELRGEFNLFKNLIDSWEVYVNYSVSEIGWILVFGIDQFVLRLVRKQLQQLLLEDEVDTTDDQP